MNEIKNREKSCGALVFKKVNNNLMFLMIKQFQNFWSFPKGHVEEGENEFQTALREVREETNIDIQLFTNFRARNIYDLGNNKTKEVIWFLATALSDELIKQDAEIREIEWVYQHEVLNKLTYPKDKKIFKEALRAIKQLEEEEELWLR